MYINVVRNGKARVSVQQLRVSSQSHQQIYMLVQIDGRQEYLGIFLTQIEVSALIIYTCSLILNVGG